MDTIFIVNMASLVSECLREQEERKQASLWRHDLLVIQGGSRNNVFRAEQ